MKLLIAFSAILAVAVARPQFFTTVGGIDPLVTKTHTQDDLGQYHYGFNDGQTAKQEVRSADGVIRGSYTYVDANNIIQKVDYTSDPFNGFQARGTNFPVGPIAETTAPLTGPIDTEEVVAAREAHFEALTKATRTGTTIDTPAVVPSSEIVELPRPVEETPEVKAARAAHLVAVNEARARNELVTRNEGVLVRSFPETGQYLTVPHAVVAPNFFRGF